MKVWKKQNSWASAAAAKHLQMPLWYSSFWTPRSRSTKRSIGCSLLSWAVPPWWPSTRAISTSWMRSVTEVAGVPALPTSALTCEGIPALRDRILALATGGAASEPGMLTNLRHHQAIVTALSAIADAGQANANSIPHEMILLDLYRALWALDSLTGQTTSDDILNLIFSSFCIGK